MQRPGRRNLIAFSCALALALAIVAGVLPRGLLASALPSSSAAPIRAASQSFGTSTQDLEPSEEGNRGNTGKDTVRTSGPEREVHLEGSPAALARTTDPVRSALSTLNLMNYYPSNAAWTNLWDRYDGERLSGDFEAMHADGLTAVRLIVQPRAVGYPAPTEVGKVADAVGRAQRAGLSVQLTLFDWFSDWSDLNGSDQWARSLLPPLLATGNVTSVEVRNELDPADAAATTWARHELATIRRLVRPVPVTISVSDKTTDGSRLSALKAALGKEQPDFYSLHLYQAGNPATVRSTLARLVAAAAPVPVHVGEVGFSVAGAASPGAGEADQDHFLRTTLSTVRDLGLPAPAVWGWSDLEATAPPHHPPATEYAFGLHRLDGSARPAMTSLRTFLTSRQVSGDFNNGFEAGDDTGPFEWKRFAAGNGSLTWDTTVARTGRASARISASGSIGAVPSWTADPVDLRVSPGQRYVLSAWARGEQATGRTRVAIAWFDADSRYQGQSESSALPTGDTDWRELRAEGTAPAGAAYAKIHLKSEGNAGTAWFDDVSIS